MRAVNYLTMDSVNAAAAESLGAACGLEIEIVDTRDLPRLEVEKADLVADWDYLPEACRTALLSGTACDGSRDRSNLAKSVPAVTRT